MARIGGGSDISRNTTICRERDYTPISVATEHTNVRSPFSSAGEGIKEENNLLFPGRLKAVTRRTKTAVLTLSRGYREGE